MHPRDFQSKLLTCLQPPIRGFDKPTGITAFLALVLGLIGISDFTAASMTENVALEYWGSQIPIRLIYFFVITAYTYLFKNDGMAMLGKSYKPSAGDHLKNGLIFSWGFVEILMWFWIYLGVREERRQVVARTIQKRERRIDN